ncbi:amino acid adenylation domain-containing protein, partial [Kitasatospora sp. NPDC058063]
MNTGDKSSTKQNAANLREELLRRRLAGKRGNHRPAITAADREQPLPLSFGQEQMWVLNRMDPESPEYLVPLALRLTGALDVGALRTAWDRIVARHEILRTRYALVGERPVQRVDAARPLDIAVVDLSHLPADDREVRARALAEEEAAAPFDLEREWPVRAKLFTLADDDHLLVVTLHHIACDAWSVGIVTRELDRFYRAAVTGQDDQPAPLPLQYADYAAWQRGELSGPALERQLSYWREQLAGLPVLDLPTDRQRPALRDPSGASVPFSIPADLAGRVGELARRHGVTRFVVLLTAYQVLLSRYTRSTDIPVGVTVSGRNRPELQELVGYGINVLVARAAWTGDPSFAELVTAGRGTVLDAYEHQAVPFARLVDELQPERDLSRTPLYQVDFIMREQRDAGLELPGVSVRRESGEGIAKVDLTLDVEDVQDGPLNARLDFATALFDRTTAERFARQYVQVLESATADPGAPLSTLEILPEEERRLVLGSWADGGAAERPQLTVDLIRAQAAATPDAVAVVVGEEHLTYRELDEQSNRIARCVLELGARPDMLIGVCLNRDVHLVPTLVGIWKAGAAYLPLDPSVPIDRLRFMLEDTQASIVVTTGQHIPTLAGIHYGTFLVLDQDQYLVDEQPDTDPLVPLDPQALAYVIYTSGSTGRPKGVMIHQHGLANYLRWTVGSYAAHGNAGAPLFSSISFDLGIPDLFTPLITGQSVHLMPMDLDTATLGPALAAAGPFSFIKLTPGHLDLLTHQLTPEQAHGLAGLVIAAGDTFPTSLADRWQRLAGPGGTMVGSEYGPTEITIGNSGSPITDLPAAELIPLGEPIPNSTMYVLTDDLAPVPVGVPGEIYIGGDGLARGYLGRPDLTAEKFVPNPFGPAGSRLYRAGDLARWLADGSLDFLGRIDNQVKIRGYRIELGEIEARLRLHPTVGDTVVSVREPSPGNKRLTAYVVAADGDTFDPEVLRAHLAAALPEYMVPTAFVAIDSIPLTGNGKVDHRALPAPGEAAAGGHRAPATALEEELTGIWGEVLGLQRISVLDSFFELGGDSIGVVRLVGALRTAGYDLTVRDVFQHRTVASLAEHLAGQATDGSLVTAVESFALIGDEDRVALPEGVVDAYPLSQIQTGMLAEMLAAQDDGAGKDVYHNVNLFRMADGRPLDQDALRGALREVLNRHQVLRTSIHLNGYSQPLQLVHAEIGDLPLRVEDLRGLDTAEQERREAAGLAHERDSAFDLTVAPLLRVGVNIESDDAWSLTLSHCHAVTDGWTLNTLLMELVECYRELRDGRELPAYEAPAVRFADFVAAELESLASEEDRAFWQDVVAEHAPLRLPESWADPQGGTRDRHGVRVPFLDLEEELHRLANDAKASVKSVLLAAHLKVLGMLSAEEAIHAGVVYHGRLEAPGAERVLGMHLNTLPFPATRASGTWREVVERVFAQEAEIWAHRRYPLPAIQRDSGTRERLVSVLFEYQDFGQLGTASVGTSVQQDIGGNEFALNVTASDGHIALNTTSDVVSRAALERLGALYRLVLEAMAADPDGDASGVVLPEAERVALVRGGSSVEWGAGSALELFRARAAAAPDAVAVVFGEERVSYGELDAWSSRIAGRLRGRGVGSGSVVGLFVDRGPGVVAAMLGVWKAGAAYVPVDPSLPAERVGYMLADSGAALVLTDADPAGRLGEYAGPWLELAGGSEESWEGVTPAADELAYVLYTSGSTGRPKGVMIGHGALVNLLGSIRDDVTPGAPGTWLASTSVSFDISGLELHLPLISGGSIVLASAEQAKDAAALVELVARNEVTHVQATPSGWRLLLAAGFEDVSVTALVGGEALTAGLARELLPQVGRLVNVYGPTETTIWSAQGEVPDGVERVSIGGPLANTRLHVLDGGLQLVPQGVTGELFIGGDGLARGYLGRPDLTAEKFVPNPFGPAGSRLYATGDLARVLADGTLECLGRIDGQVKVRGYRIELGEIESALREHAWVRDAVVTAQEDAHGDKSLVAYVVSADDSAPDTVALREFLSRSLPEYMVPAVFVTLDVIPLTNSGKVDHKALPVVDQTAFASAEIVAPRTPLEERLAAIWSDVLGVARVGVEDSFFELGGDSIRVVRLVGALRAAGYEASIRTVFTHTTIAGLAGVLAGNGGASLVTAVEPFALIGDGDRAALPEGVVDAYPLSQIQTGMLVEMMAAQGRGESAYLNINSFRIPDTTPFDLDALTKAAAVVTGRHEALRTSLDFETYSQPLQLVHAETTIPVRIEDLRGLTADEQRAALLAFTAREEAESFDLGTAPLLRIAIHLESDEAWRLTFTYNHAIAEGWSYHSLLMELLASYQHLRDGRELPAYEAPAVRYADFIAAELESLASEEDRAFWRNVVADHTPFELPSGWRAQGGAKEPYRLEVDYRDLEDGLRRLARRTSTSLKSVLLAAHLKVLSMLSPERAFHTGVVYHGRLEAPGAERVLGMHLNTLPFPATRPSGTWRQLVEQVFAQEAETWAHRRYPLPAVQRDSGTSQRLLTVMFDHQNFHQVDTGTVDAGAGLGVGVNEFALAVIATGGVLAIKSSTDELGRDRAEQLSAMYRLVLEAMASDPEGDATAAYIPHLEQTAVPRMRTEPDQRELSLDLFRARAVASPDAVAVVFGGERVSYGELDAWSSRIAGRLRGQGVGSGSVVGLYLDRGPGVLAAMLGVWKAGAAYLPVDPSLPAERVGYMLADSGAALVLTDADPTDRLGEYAGPWLALDGGSEESWEGVTPAADELAYVLYTSGSTGRPKGVMIGHGALVNLLGSIRDDVTPGRPGTWLASTSVSFDISGLELHLPLITGGKIVLASAEQAKDAAALVELVARNRVTHVQATPSGWRLLLEAGFDNYAVTALVGGEALTAGLARELLPQVGRLVNVYGPTETTIWSAQGEVPDGVEQVSIGGPLANTRLHVLDVDLNPVPQGVTGELFIGGDGLARGYLGRPDLTAEKFVPNPFGPAGSRLYATGDLARVLPDGTLECLGRIDGQVKIRGYRIELGEIESALREHTSVRDAVVAAHEDAQGDKSLVAYVVPAGGSGLDTAALREFLARSLPEYMVPTAFVALDVIPLTNSGKVDHKALPAPDADAFAQSAYVAPRTPVEERLAAVWSDVLGVTRVGVEDSFFDLGGDSIRVVRLVGALRATGYDVTVQDVFELRTVARLAQKLSGQEAGASLVTTVEPFALIGDEDRAALPEGVVDAYPLSQVQTGMLVEMMANPGTAVYHNLNSFLIPDTRPFQPETLRAALAHVVQRHDILRTSVEMTGYSQPLQFVHATAELPLSLHDLRELDAAGLDAARAEFAALDRATPFDVTAAPLVRLAVHLESDEAWRLVLSHCHAVTEGWTANSLMTEIVAAYQQLRDRGEATDEEAPAVRYADFIAAELESLASEQDRAFWRDVIGRHAPMLVPAGWGESTGTVERHWAHAPFADLEEDLRRLAARARTSLKSVLLAAHLKVLGSLTSEEAFHTGVVYHGRLEAPGAERVLGMHLNTLPFPATRPSGTWRELVEGVYARESEIWAHRRYPLPAIQRDSGTGERLITMLFDHQDFHQVDTDTVDVDANIGDGVNEFAVNVTAARGRISIGSTTEVLSGWNLARLAEMYRLVLEAMVADFDGDASVACLPGAERASLVGEWNATVEVPVDGCLHEVFAEQAVRTPDAVAVVFGAESLTYAQVDERANRLAQRLVALGAGPDDLVGVSLERGLDLVPTLLGVMKSGAAYLPLDPVNPDERLSYILQDAGARILVTESSLAGRLTGSFEGRVVVLDDEAEQALIAGLPAVAPATAVTPDNLIYVIYTSGSTGKPKGVALSHANVLRLFTSSERHYHFDAQDVWPLFHSYAFDVSVWEMWGALLHGGRLVVVPATVTRSPDEFLSLLVGTGATILCQTPTAFRSLVAMAAEGDPRIDRLNLRAVVFAGERLDLAQLLPWTDRVGAQRPALINMYGITETTVHSTFRQITEEDLAHPADSPVGIPLDDTVIHVLDAAGQLVPVGVPGEIFVGGPAVARGYLDRPELTAERFTPDPFGPAGSRLYRSGDLARRLADGTLESLGRIDGQVKIRGYRIELGEIETALRAHPSVGSAAVIARTSEDGEKVLVAYVVPAEESGSDAADLRAHLRGSLPDYMVPAAYVAVQAIPLTPNGKLDHRALPAPDRSAFAASRHVAPRTPVEERFAEVWGEVLGLE